eukprot:CAMPEP_0204571708 /NCGR_PEP_ID=MMETSP0661-20131031/39044_1 /ASSEMBLY_ACC=CAM_ASM_000606 /TAXON_ID=109239 /ORGANISM="Alexandrium margalefi, Strain AMGDE01CS-322" /LENGTH=77 /DNA_ID=CAMNT_0051579989 /DNA_START=330 /DNA_END=560 /DNA_ORIENTATION=+
MVALFDQVPAECDLPCPKDARLKVDEEGRPGRLYADQQLYEDHEEPLLDDEQPAGVNLRVAPWHLLRAVLLGVAAVL